MAGWKVVAYYTEGSSYAACAEKFIRSCKENNVPFDVAAIKDQGGWDANTHYKPTFIRSMLEKWKGHSIIYVDIDAQFCRYPHLFDHMHTLPEIDVAVHVLDHSRYRRKHHRPEMLSGTIYFANTEISRNIIDEWIQQCAARPKEWDQRVLEKVLRNKVFYSLPGEYCMIYDYMTDISKPVIKHFQESRNAKKKPARPRQNSRSVKKKRQPRVVKENGVMKIRRIHK